METELGKIERLLNIYFNGRDERRKLMKERSSMSSGCLHQETSPFGECMSAFKDGLIEEIEMCSVCRRRNRIHQRLKEIGYSNGGAITQIRAVLNARNIRRRKYGLIKDEVIGDEN